MEVGGNSFRIDYAWQRKRSRKLAVSALDLVILLTRDARVASSLQGDPSVVYVDADLFARQAW